MRVCWQQIVVLFWEDIVLWLSSRNHLRCYSNYATSAAHLSFSPPINTTNKIYVEFNSNMNNKISPPCLYTVVVVVFSGFVRYKTPVVRRPLVIRHQTLSATGTCMFKSFSEGNYWLERINYQRWILFLCMHKLYMYLYSPLNWYNHFSKNYIIIMYQLKIIHSYVLILYNPDWSKK